MAMTGIWVCAQLPNSPATAEATLAVMIIAAPVRPVLPPPIAAKPQHKAAKTQNRLMIRASGREVVGMSCQDHRPWQYASRGGGFDLHIADLCRNIRNASGRSRLRFAAGARFRGERFSRMSGRDRIPGLSMQSPMQQPEPRPAGCAKFAMCYLGHFASLLPGEGPAIAATCD